MTGINTSCISNLVWTMVFVPLRNLHWRLHKVILLIRKKKLLQDHILYIQWYIRPYNPISYKIRSSLSFDFDRDILFANITKETKHRMKPNYRLQIPYWFFTFLTIFSFWSCQDFGAIGWDDFMFRLFQAGNVTNDQSNQQYRDYTKHDLY